MDCSKRFYEYVPLTLLAFEPRYLPYLPNAMKTVKQRLSTARTAEQAPISNAKQSTTQQRLPRSARPVQRSR